MSLLCHLILRLISRIKSSRFQTIFLLHLYTFLNSDRSIIFMSEELLAIHIAIFASGQGTNAREIIRYFHEDAHMVLGARLKFH